MLQIDESHFRAFSALHVERFVQQMLEHLPKHFADEIAGHRLDQPLLEQWVRYGVDLARYYNIQGEKDIRLFIECLLMFSTTFDRDPKLKWPREILNREDLSGTEKMDLIHDHIIFSTNKGR